MVSVLPCFFAKIVVLPVRPCRLFPSGLGFCSTFGTTVGDIARLLLSTSATFKDFSLTSKREMCDWALPDLPSPPASFRPSLLFYTRYCLSMHALPSSSQSLYRLGLAILDKSDSTVIPCRPSGEERLNGLLLPYE